MPTLDRPKYEAMARNLARGLTQEEAYKQAGYSGGAQSAWRLANMDIIVKRVKEILDEREDILQHPTIAAVDEDTGEEVLISVTMDWVISRLAENVQSAQTMGNHGAANKALEMLGHHLGMTFSDKSKGDPDNPGKGVGTGKPGDTYNFLQLTDKLELHQKSVDLIDVTPEAVKEPEAPDAV